MYQSVNSDSRCCSIAPTTHVLLHFGKQLCTLLLHRVDNPEYMGKITVQGLLVTAEIDFLQTIHTLM